MRSIVTFAATIAAVILVSVALWVRQETPQWVSDWQSERPQALLWAIRCSVIALIAAAQAILLQGVVGRIYSKTRFDLRLRLGFVAAAFIAAISAVALGLASR